MYETCGNHWCLRVSMWTIFYSEVGVVLAICCTVGVCMYSSVSSDLIQSQRVLALTSFNLSVCQGVQTKASWYLQMEANAESGADL